MTALRFFNVYSKDGCTTSDGEVVQSVRRGKVGLVHNRYDGEFNVVVSQELDAAEDSSMTGPSGHIESLDIVLLKAVYADADFELVLAKQSTPLIIDKRAVRLNGVRHVSCASILEDINERLEVV